MDRPPIVLNEGDRRARPLLSAVSLAGRFARSFDRVDFCVVLGLGFVWFGVSYWSEPAAHVSVGTILLTFAFLGARR